MSTSHSIKSDDSSLTNQQEDTLSKDEHSIQQLKQYWFCRSLLFCNGAKRLAKELFHQDEILDLLEFKRDEFEDVKPTAQYKNIKKRSEKSLDISITRQGTLFTNIQQINQHFGLDDVETEIMLFATLIELDPDYGNCYDLYGQLSNRYFCSFLARILDIPNKKIIEALKKESLLHQSGLLKLNSSARDIDCKFDLLKGFCSALDIPQKSITSLFSDFITPAPAAVLTPKHYNHIKTDYSRLSGYLQAACEKKILGANILIYGSPGTGKTQWVRTIADELKIKLYEVSVEDTEGDILSGKDRVTACQLAQKLLEKGHHQCILFDEIEDLFQGQYYESSRSSSTTNKGWINQLLENNAIPTFWLTNDISIMDEAFLRRFDLVFELPAPPHSVRKNMLTESLKDTSVSEQWIDRISHLDHLPPAIINRATRVNKIIGESTPELTEQNLEQIIGNTLKAMGHKHRAVKPTSCDFYAPNLINTKAPLDKITQGLKLSGEGRLCFFGPPGTGKSAYAKYLAEQLDIPLIAKRASDIIDCYIGNTEKNIALMFEQAKNEKGLLLLDEADSFLRDRKNSRQSWETTQVNELLVQMENFDGIFICSTNLMKDLDEASMRRFDFKLEFNYLKTEQAWQLLKGYLDGALEKATPEKQESLKKQLASMQLLTPGDFAAVRRRLTVLGELEDIDLFVKSLQEEVTFKDEGAKRAIGFNAEF